MNEKKYIICVDRVGMANRLKCLISIMRLSKILGRELILYWPNNKYCGCDFEDLFENSFPKIGEEELKKIKKEGNYKFYKDVLDNENNHEKYLLFKTWKFVFLSNEIPENFAKVFPSKEGKNIDFEYHRIPEHTRQKVLIYINKLKPKMQIVVDDFAEKYNLKDCIGVHIR